MVMWMIYDRVGLARNRDYVTMYRNICEEYGIGVEAVLDSHVKERITGGETPVFVLMRTISPPLSKYIEDKGIPVFNSYQVSRICNDKGKTLEYCKNHVLSVPSLSFHASELSWVLSQKPDVLREYFRKTFLYSTHEEQERSLIEHAEDFVLKATDGHGGGQVFSLCHEKEKISPEMAHRDFVLQPMIPCGEYSRDMRVYVIGKEIVAAVMRSSGEGFRANYSLGADVSLYGLNESEKDTVNRVIREFDFGMAGIDFIYDVRGQMILNEIEDVVGARMLYRLAPELDIARQYIQFILACGAVMPEKLHIVQK